MVGSIIWNFFLSFLGRTHSLLHYLVWYYWEVLCRLILSVWKSFLSFPVCRELKKCQMLFVPWTYWNEHMVFPFYSVIWWIKLINFLLLNQPYTPGIHLTWSWCIIGFIFSWIWFATILKGLLHLYKWGLLVCNFLFMSFSYFGYQGCPGIMKWFGKFPPFSVFWKSLYNWCYFFPNSLVKFSGSVVDCFPDFSLISEFQQFDDDVSKCGFPHIYFARALLSFLDL